MYFSKLIYIYDRYSISVKHVIILHLGRRACQKGLNWILWRLPILQLKHDCRVFPWILSQCQKFSYGTWCKWHIAIYAEHFLLSSNQFILLLLLCKLVKSTTNYQKFTMSFQSYRNWSLTNKFVSCYSFTCQTFPDIQSYYRNKTVYETRIQLSCRSI